MAAGNDKSAKDKQMAAYMKAHGIRRTSSRCVICYRQVQLDHYPSHIISCQGKGGYAKAKPSRRGG